MTLRPRDKIALALVGAVAIVAAFYMLVLAPVRHTAAALSTTIATAQSSLTQDESSYEVGRAAKESLAKHRATWAALGRAVPASANVPQLLRVIQREADGAGVRVEAITMTGGASSSGASSSVASTNSTTSTTGSAASTQATAVPVSLTFVGSYQSLDRLIGRLDGLVEVSRGQVRAKGPLMSIASVDLSGSSSKITAQMTASIYQLDAATSATEAS